MTSDEFKAELKNPKNVYCLVSSDSKMIDLYVKRFKEAIQADQIVYGKIMPYGRLFKKKTLNVLYTNKITEDLFKRSEYIFIHTDDIDKRSAIYKQYKNHFIELSNDFTKYIMQHSDLNKDQATKLAKSCKNDLGIIENTLNHISSIVIIPLITDSPVSILALVSTNCQNLLKVKRNQTEGMNPYAVKHLRLLTKYRTEQELATIISNCFYLDSQMKKGLINVNDLLGYLIIIGK